MGLFSDLVKFSKKLPKSVSIYCFIKVPDIFWTAVIYKNIQHKLLFFSLLFRPDEINSAAAQESDIHYDNSTRATAGDSVKKSKIIHFCKTSPAWEDFFIMCVNHHGFSLYYLYWIKWIISVNCYYIILLILKRLQIISQKYAGIYPPYPVLKIFLNQLI